MTHHVRHAQIRLGKLLTLCVSKCSKRHGRKDYKQKECVYYQNLVD